jgi:hypothetical protein
MSKREAHHWAAEHLWRALRALILLGASAVWLYTDATHLVLILLILATIVDQLHGYICRNIQKLFGWYPDFKSWE